MEDRLTGDLPEPEIVYVGTPEPPPLRCRLFGHKTHRRGILNVAPPETRIRDGVLRKARLQCVRCKKVI